MREAYAYIRKVPVRMCGYSVSVHDSGAYRHRVGWAMTRMGADLMARHLLRSYERAQEKERQAPVQWTVRLSDEKKEDN